MSVINTFSENKVKVFRFRMNNQFSDTSEQGLTPAQRSIKSNYVTIEQIEEEVNAFLMGVDLVSMHTNTVDVNYHNNGYQNTIDLVYTIVYRDVL